MERKETLERSAGSGPGRNVGTALNGVALAANLPERVELVPAGEVKGRDGRRWVNDNPLSILERFALQGTDLPVDIEHSTELRAPKGEPAPAAGWVYRLEVVNGAVWGLSTGTKAAGTSSAAGNTAISARLYFTTPALAALPAWHRSP